MIKDMMLIVIGVVIIWFAVKIVFDVENPFYVVSSGSMIPELNVGDILIVKNGDSFNNLKVGDIIIFNRPQGGDRVIVHRILDIYESLGEKVIVTKGDANDGVIPGTDFPIKEKDYIGKLETADLPYVIPKVGLVLQYLKPPINYIIIAGIIGVLIYSNFRKGKDEKDINSGKSTTTT